VIAVRGLAEVLARLRAADPAGTMATALDGQAHALAAGVRDLLGTQPGGAHGQPWRQTGALQASIGHVSEGLQATVGSSDPAAAPQELGTVHVPPRPFLAPVAAAEGAGTAEAVGAAVAKRLRMDGADAGRSAGSDGTPPVISVGFADTEAGAAGILLGLGLMYLMARQADTPQPGHRPRQTTPPQGPAIVAAVPLPPPREGETPVEVLKPDGQRVGEPGTSPDIRVLPGGDTGARELFDRLTKGGGTDITPPGYKGRIVRTPDGSVINYRPSSKSGPPTVDVVISGVNIRKLKFPETAR